MNKDIPFELFSQRVSIPILGTAIVNPYGPTFAGYALCGNDQGAFDLVDFSLNPFGQSAEGIAVYQPIPEKFELPELFTRFTVYSDIRAHLLKLKNAGTPAGTPTILLDRFQESDDFQVAERRLTLDAVVRYSGDPSSTLELLRSYPLNVMDRVSHEMDIAAESIGKEPPETRAVTDQEVAELVSIITDPKHIREELSGFIYGWNGSIDFQKTGGNAGFANAAVDIKTALKMILTWFPTVGEILEMPRN